MQELLNLRFSLIDPQTIEHNSNQSAASLALVHLPKKCPLMSKLKEKTTSEAITVTQMGERGEPGTIKYRRAKGKRLKRSTNQPTN